jgi:hypothetical protein
VTPVKIFLQEGRARYEIRKGRDTNIGNIVVSAGDKDAVKQIK